MKNLKAKRRKLLKITIDEEMFEFMKKGGFYIAKPDKFPEIKIRIEVGEMWKIQ